MTPPPRSGPPPRFWSEARASPRRLLALDYDGTLAPLVVDPGVAVPLPASLAALRRILDTQRTSIAILSGRPCADVTALLGATRGSPPVPIVGEHGWSELSTDGALLRHPIPPGLVERLDAAEAAARLRLAPARVERKRTALVIHTRGLEAGAARDAEAGARRLFEGRFASPALAVRAIDGGVELRARGRDKGIALGELAARLGAGAFVAAVGDDETDEDAFRVAATLGGWGLVVGSRRPTAARARLASVEAVARFLAEWVERVDLAPAAASRRTASGRRA